MYHVTLNTDQYITIMTTLGDRMAHCRSEVKAVIHNRYVSEDMRREVVAYWNGRFDEAHQAYQVMQTANKLE